MIVWAGEVTWRQAAELRERLFDEIEDTRPESASMSDSSRRSIASVWRS